LNTCEEMRAETLPPSQLCWFRGVFGLQQMKTLCLRSCSNFKASSSWYKSRRPFHWNQIEKTITLHALRNPCRTAPIFGKNLFWTLICLFQALKMFVFCYYFYCNQHWIKFSEYNLLKDEECAPDCIIALYNRQTNYFTKALDL